METPSPSSSFSNTDAKWTTKRLRLRSGAKGIDIDRRLEESHEQTSPKVTSPKMGLPRSCKRKRGQGGDLTQLAGRFGSINVRGEMEEMEERYSQLSAQAQNCIFRDVPRQSDFSTIFKMDPGQFLRGLPLLRMRLERHFISEKMFRIRNRIDLADFHNTYMVAQNNPDVFLQYSAKEIFRKGECVVARTGRKSSIVKQRLVDILFFESSPAFLTSNQWRFRSHSKYIPT
jgi:hypothetical protein